MSHANATLNEGGRLKMARLVVGDGWTQALAAERFSISITTVRRWVARYRRVVAAGRTPTRADMVDRSSRPRRSPHQLGRRAERRIIGLRVSRRWGPARIAYHLGLNPSTVHKVLQRYRCPRLKWTDPATGIRVRTSRADKHSYVHPACGDLIHVDIKKLGRIPDGGGWRFRGLAAGKRNKQKKPAGYAYLHHAVDDHSRLAYSEIHRDQRKETAVAFWKRAVKFFAAHAITIKAVLTDNGSCYCSRLWARALGRHVKHKRTRPYRPQTNGKVERFNRTLLEEWAYAHEYRSEADRAAAYPAWLHTYNHHRGHSSLKGKAPIDLVPNVPGQNT
jgi:transposase InsO family protein